MTLVHINGEMLNAYDETQYVDRRCKNCGRAYSEEHSGLCVQLGNGERLWWHDWKCDRVKVR